MKTQVVRITPELAKEYLKKNTKNRPKKERRINEYIGYLKRGEWKLTHEGIAFSETGILLDGQNRLEAIVRSGVSTDMAVTTGLSDSVMTVLNTGTKRTTGDAFSLLEVPNAVKVSASITIYIKFKMGLTSILDKGGEGSNKSTLSNDERYHLYLENSAVIDKCVQLAQKCQSSAKFFTESTIAGFCIFLILERRHSFAKVMKYMLNLHMIENDNISACKILSKILLRTETGNEKLKPIVKLTYLIKSWNAYCDGDQVSGFKYIASSQMPQIK